MKNSIIALFAMLSIGCAHKESEEVQTSDVQVVIAASFAQTADSTSQTRATATAFQSGDMLGLYAVKSGGELNAASNIINNHQLKVSASGAITGSDLPAYYPDKSSAIDLFSYYPYQSGNATADALGVLVGIRTIQTDFSHVQASDLCYGRKLDAAPTAAPHPLQFSHSFAQLRLNFSLYEGCSAIATVKLLSIKDSAKLNLQTGAVTLLPHIADVNPFVNSADATDAANATVGSSSAASATSSVSPLQFTAIIPAQSLSGPCVEITLKDGTIYYYHATTPIALKASATNTLNLNIYSRIGGDPADPSDPSAESDKGGVRLAGAPAITAWGVEPSSAVLGDAVNNLITLYWLAPHADYAKVDKVTLTITDPLGVVRDIDLTPTLNPMSSTAYAVLDLPLTLAGSYPLTISRVRIYNGATLLRDAQQGAIVGRTLAKAGNHTLGLNLAIEITPKSWLNVNGYGESKTVTVTPTGTTEWTATSDNSGLTITKSGNEAILTWASYFGVGQPASRSAMVTFQTNPKGVIATLNSTQNIIPDHITINGLKWKTYNVGAADNSPWECGNRYNWPTALGICPSGWRVPETTEFVALCNNKGGQNITYNLSDAGAVWVTSPIPGVYFNANFNKIFFPAGGNTDGSAVGSAGNFWSATFIYTYVVYAFHFNPTTVQPQTRNSDSHGFSVRCVQ